MPDLTSSVSEPVQLEHVVGDREPLETLRFLNSRACWQIAEKFGTPVYVYDEPSLRLNAKTALAFPNAFGLTVRYAMKACPTKEILNLFLQEGVEIDASSVYEVQRAKLAGVAVNKISLTAQEIFSQTAMPSQALEHQHKALAQLFEEGLLFNAASLQQIHWYGQFRAKAPDAFPHTLGIRFNPGEGSGGNNRTNVGGANSSFGVWYKDLDEVKQLIEQYGLVVNRIHTHIGSGSDPAVWKTVAEQSLAIVAQFPQADTLNLGGGFKVGRMANEISTDLQEIGAPVKALFEKFEKQYSRKLKLEIEPGTFLVANAGAIISEIIDRKSTQDVQVNTTQGHQFLLVNTGMNDLLRPSLYGAQHPLVVVPKSIKEIQEGSDLADSDAFLETVVVCGHNCESGDLLTPEPGNAEYIKPRVLTASEVGDLLVIEGVGAYASSMSATNYNSFPMSAEVLYCHDEAGERFKLIRKKQTLAQLLENEL